MINRRNFFRLSGVCAAGSVIGSPYINPVLGNPPEGPAAGNNPAGNTPVTEFISRVTINPFKPNSYQGWPTVALLPNDELMVVASGGRQEHVCPFGRVVMFRSTDGGLTWSDERTILNHPADDRDAGICVTAKGTILVTSFTSFAYYPQLEAERKRRKEGAGRWSDERYDRWLKANEPFESVQARKDELGCWMIRSEDNGQTWSERYSSIVNSPHGPVQLSDGRLLYAGKRLWDPEKGLGTRAIGVCESKDDGRTWSWLAEIPAIPGDKPDPWYHELHAVQAASGRIIVQLRSHAPTSNQMNLQTESDDGGKTWSPLHSTGVWGIPSHLLKLADNRILMTYGHRRAPWGCQARLSSDEGRTWSTPIILSECAATDLGYPATVQASDGSLFTVWYESGALKGVRWTVK